MRVRELFQNAGSHSPPPVFHSAPLSISKKNNFFFAFIHQETTERATKEFHRAHRRALSGFLLPASANYSASLGNSSTGVTAPKVSPFLNVSSAGTISVAEALNYPGPENATRFEFPPWLSKIRTRGANIRTTFLEEDNVMRVAEAVFKAVSNPLNGGLLLRIAFHECGTFDYRGPTGRKGGCNGSIRYEFEWASNGGEYFVFLFLGGEAEGRRGKKKEKKALTFLLSHQQQQ